MYRLQERHFDIEQVRFLGGALDDPYRDYQRCGAICWLRLALKGYSSSTQLLFDRVLDSYCGKATCLDLLCNGLNVNVDTIESAQRFLLPSLGLADGN